jgi:hypothetical protein
VTYSITDLTQPRYSMEVRYHPSHRVFQANLGMQVVRQGTSVGCH